MSNFDQLHPAIQHHVVNSLGWRQLRPFQEEVIPGILAGPLNESILKRGREKGLLSVQVRNIRDYTGDKHKTADDSPYGGGAGMVMKPDPIFTAVERVYQSGPIILMSPQGRVFTQTVARELAQEPRVTLLCGHYEGIDERVREHLATDEISIGDYVLTGGELPALLVIDAVSRLLPGVLGDPDGALDDSHASGLLEYPHYTRPPEFRGSSVPEALLSGDHAKRSYAAAKHDGSAIRSVLLR